MRILGPIRSLPARLLPSPANVASSSYASLPHDVTEEKSVPTNNTDNQPSRLTVFLTVSFHITIALSVTLLNKWALNNVPLPQVLLAFQTGICVLFSLIVKIVSSDSIGPLNIDVKEIKRLWPYLFMRTLAVGMKVWCLNLVPASFYQVSRGLLLPITVSMSFAFLGNRISSAILKSILVICLGFIVGSIAKYSASASFDSSPRPFEAFMALLDLGFILGILSTFTTAAETIVVKLYAPNLPVFRAVYTTSLVGFVVFSALSLTSGGVDQFKSLLTATTTHKSIITPILVSSVAYYLVSIAAVLQITVTTPVTHTISTAVRGVLQSLLAVVLLPNESLSGWQVVSIGFILAGSIRYTWVKEMEKRQKQRNTGVEAAKMDLEQKAGLL
ncbi:uncharacterized protein I303_106359 [Kwoniella dejecticola CBS 10117]|uniref:Sugar phosphate transporter domain-containing protein n=1 Tax=Kwoniella dejecticola CBS 10117 TaxID=1296121 RepID=A0A1A5ZUX7_9TREE|nr:uncharacterized protein I303_08384 [Kwoniella dejecticola CBS 10117]OBR81613.1 hypothetical protein I303_08384 [Kwoniella dejecticola CBS 10117]